jgi:hypothetical protein
MLYPMTRSRPRAAVCIVRIERESWGLIITVTVNRDVSRARPEEPVRFTRTSEAAAAVARFLDDFDNDHPPDDSPPDVGGATEW